MEIECEVLDPIDLLLAVKDTEADVVVMNLSESQRTPEICTHLLTEFPDLLVIDGQQRLTSLYAVMRGVRVKRQSFAEERIHIAFCPLDSSFQVADAAIRRDPTWIPNISVVWAEDGDINYFIEPDTDHLLRVSVGLGFRRALLQHVYSILRGKDLETGEFSEERRRASFAFLTKLRTIRSIFKTGTST